MGYRSEVAIVIKNEDYEKYIKGNSQIKELINEAEIKGKDNIVVLYWDWIKWYPEYEDVGAMESILDCIGSCDHPYAFVRIGEETNDVEFIEVEGKDYEYLGEYVHPVTYIERPLDWEKI